MSDFKDKVEELRSKIEGKDPNRDSKIEKLYKATFEEEKKEEEQEKAVEVEKEKDDTTYYDEVTNTVRPNPYSVKRRREVEARSSKLDLTEILIKQRAEQKIVIIPGKFEILLRDTTGLEDTFIKNQLAKEYYNRDEVSAAYITSKMARYRLTFSLLQINGKPLTDITIENEPASDKELKDFKEKLLFISKYPDDIIQELDIQFIWLKDRIKSISMGEIQNFSKAQ